MGEDQTNQNKSRGFVVAVHVVYSFP